MSYLIDFAAFLLNILWYVIFIQVVLSWLVSFNVINLSNPTVRQIVQAIDRVTEPMYRPIRKVLPDFGGLDFSPLVVLLLDTFLLRELSKLSYQLSSNV